MDDHIIRLSIMALHLGFYPIARMILTEILLRGSTVVVIRSPFKYTVVVI